MTSKTVDNEAVARLRIVALQAKTRLLPGARLLARAPSDTAANLSTIIENSEATRSPLPAGGLGSFFQ